MDVEYKNIKEKNDNNDDQKSEKQINLLSDIIFKIFNKKQRTKIKFNNIYDRVVNEFNLTYNMQQLYKDLKSLRFVYVINNDEYYLLLDKEDICICNINNHQGVCKKIHNIDNTIVCNRHMDLQSFNCGNNNCFKIHLEAIKIKSKIFNVLSYGYARAVVHSNNQLKLEQYQIRIEVFNQIYTTIYKLYPASFLKPADLNYCLKLWIKIIKSYSEHTFPNGNTINLWNIRSNMICINVKMNIWNNAICREHIQLGRCTNDRIFHPTFCGQIHAYEKCICVEGNNINPQFKYTVAIESTKQARIEYRNDFYALYRNCKIDAQLKSGLYIRKFIKLNENNNTLKLENIGTDSYPIYEGAGIRVQNEAQIELQINYGTYAIKDQNEIIIYEVINVYEINDMVVNIALHNNILDIYQQSISKNCCMSFLIRNVGTEYWITYFIKTFRFMKSLWFAKRKTSINFNLVNNKLLVEVKNINILMDTKQVIHWFYKTVEHHTQYRINDNLAMYLVIEKSFCYFTKPMIRNQCNKIFLLSSTTINDNGIKLADENDIYHIKWNIHKPKERFLDMERILYNSNKLMKLNEDFNKIQTYKNNIKKLKQQINELENKYQNNKHDQNDYNQLTQSKYNDNVITYQELPYDFGNNNNKKQTNHHYHHYNNKTSHHQNHFCHSQTLQYKHMKYNDGSFSSNGHYNYNNERKHVILNSKVKNNNKQGQYHQWINSENEYYVNNNTNTTTNNQCDYSDESTESSANESDDEYKDESIIKYSCDKNASQKDNKSVNTFKVKDVIEIKINENECDNNNIVKISGVDDIKTNNNEHDAYNADNNKMDEIFQIEEIIRIKNNKNKYFAATINEITNDGIECTTFENETYIFNSSQYNKMFWKFEIKESVAYDAKIKKEKETIKQELQRLKFKVKNIQADGNCLYRCFSFITYKTENKHMQIRKKIVDFIEKNANKFKIYMIDDESKGKEKIVSFINNLQDKKKNGCYGDQIDIDAWCKMYNKYVKVYTLKEYKSKTKLESIDSWGHYNYNERPTKLLYYRFDKHYDIILE